MDKHKKRVVIWISSVTLIVVLVLGTLLIIRSYNIRKYTYIPGETEFIFQLKSSGSWFDEICELTADGQLIFSNNDIRDKQTSNPSEVWNLSEDEIKFLADYIIIDHKFYKWTKYNQINEENYGSIRSNYEETLVTLTVTFNGESKTIGRYFHGHLSPKENKRTDNMVVKEVASFFDKSQKAKRLVEKHEFDTSVTPVPGGHD